MLILCCGNPDRGDDAAGFLVAEHLKRLRIDVRCCTGEASELLDLWSRSPEVLVVDAVVTGAPAGTIHSWDAAQTKLPPTLSESTHGFGLAHAIELARTLRLLPARLRVYGIEGANFELGRRPCLAVQRAAIELANKIATE